MANYESTNDLKLDVLFRSSESRTGVSGWDSKVIEYLNRCYRELATGASSFLPEFVEDWWWMREEASILLEPAYTTGTVSVVKGAPTATFSVVVPHDPNNWRMRFQGVPDIFIITSSGAGSAGHTLDQPFTGASGNYTFFMMKTEYDIGTNIQALIGSMTTYQDPDNRIDGVTPERMDDLWPPIRLMPGMPKNFSLENRGNSTTVRFSHGGNTDGTTKARVDYRYRPRLTALVDSPADIPRVPIEYRHVLADMALVYVLLDKNDDRSNAAALGARTTLAAMLKENRRQNVKMGSKVGHIAPRPNNSTFRGPLRTESGLIIG